MILFVFIYNISIVLKCPFVIHFVNNIGFWRIRILCNTLVPHAMSTVLCGGTITLIFLTNFFYFFTFFSFSIFFFLNLMIEIKSFFVLKKKKIQFFLSFEFRSLRAIVYGGISQSIGVVQRCIQGINWTTSNIVVWCKQYVVDVGAWPYQILIWFISKYVVHNL